MLLNAYGWWKVSQITYIASIVAFALGGLALLGSLFGLTLGRRWRRDGVEVAVTVDRADSGWSGEVGLVTALIKPAGLAPDNTVAFVCGPDLMMRFTADALAAHGIPAGRIRVSLERNMRCGVGWCGHCQLGPLLVCRDGPVVGYDRAAALMRAREL
jgi:NAD(P)H-flavin reductase